MSCKNKCIRLFFNNFFFLQCTALRSAVDGEESDMNNIDL